MKKLTTKEFIKRAKNIHGDKYSYKKSLYQNSKKKLIITCKVDGHGDFEQTPGGHLINKSGCPKCKGGIKSNKEEFINKAMAFHGNLYDYSKVVYKNSSTNVKIKCKKHGFFEQSPNKHLSHGCKKCGHELGISKITHSGNQFVEKARNVHGNLYDYSRVKYVRSRSRVIIICPKHGEFLQTPDMHISGNGCPYCAGKKVGPLNNVEFLYPKVAAEWHPTKNVILPSEISPGSRKKIWFVCNKGHEYQTNLVHRTKPNPTGCPYCSGNKISDENNLNARFPKIAKEWHPKKNKLKAIEVMPGSPKKYWWLCPKGHEYKASPDKRTGSGTSCPFCTSQTSTQEMRIMAELNYLGIKILSRYKYKNIEFDVYLPDFNIGIEYDGSYWHRHNENKDKNKNKFAKKNNINLIRIREHPLKKLSKKDICTSSNAHITKEEINDVMDSIKVFVNNLDAKIERYKKLKEFVNEDLFNIYLSYSPSPFPEKSLEHLCPEVCKEWHYEKNFPLTPKNFTKGSNQKVWWKCSRGHEWKTSIYHRTSKNPTGCYQCYLEDKRLRKNKLANLGNK